MEQTPVLKDDEHLLHLHETSGSLFCNEMSSVDATEKQWRKENLTAKVGEDYRRPDDTPRLMPSTADDSDKI